MVIDIETLRKETNAIIAINPIDIVFTRHERVTDAHGNVTETKTETALQRIRLAELGHRENEALVQEGLLDEHRLNITASYNADIQKGDKFTFQGDRYVVEFIRKITVGGYDEVNCYKMSGIAKELKEGAE